MVRFQDSMTTFLPRPSVTAAVEWPTVGLALACYAVWALALFAPLWVAVPLAAIAIALHSSLCHETIHGHPFGNRAANAALVWPALSLLIPYARFRDTHLAHHRDDTLTDPYDDPESNFLDAADWDRLRPALRLLHRANNTLAGRMVLGPIIGQAAFMASDWRLARRRDGAAVRRAWAEHIVSAALVLTVVALSPMPLWAYAISAWAGLGIVKIRTFLEHCAAEDAAGRTVIVEDRGPLAFLFLNNNLHAVHHTHPRVAWFRLPALYAADRARYLGRNGGYRYASYAEVFRRHLWRAKDPVAHPLRRR